MVALYDDQEREAVLEEQKIAELRRQIDDMDANISKLLNERARIVRRIKDLKTKAQLATFDPQREQEILTKLVLANGGPLGDEELQEIYKSILHYMRNFE